MPNTKEFPPTFRTDWIWWRNNPKTQARPTRVRYYKDGTTLYDISGYQHPLKQNEVDSGRFGESCGPCKGLRKSWRK